jgi:hypothetical protein
MIAQRLLWTSWGWLQGQSGRDVGLALVREARTSASEVEVAGPVDDVALVGEVFELLAVSAGLSGRECRTECVGSSNCKRTLR